MSQRRVLRGHVAVELAVVVIGVLIALWAENTWSGLRDRTREAALLEDLREEFTENRERLLSDIEVNRVAVAAKDSWLAALSGSRSVEGDSVFTLYQQTWNTARFDPITGTLRALIDGGELGLLRSLELRRASAGWSDRALEANLSNQAGVQIRAELAPHVSGLTPPVSPSELRRAWLSGQFVEQAHLELVLREIEAILSLLDRELAGGAAS